MTPRCKPIPISSLSRSHFELWPIWSEFYDDDELLEIASWGVSKDEFLADLEDLDLGNEHAAYPVLDLSYVPDRMRVYIRAAIRCADDRTLDGYIVNPDAYAFCVFVGEVDYLFNKNLAAEYQEELRRLASALHIPPDMIRPKSFRTNFHDEAGALIAGEFATP